MADPLAISDLAVAAFALLLWEAGLAAVCFRATVSQRHGLERLATWLSLEILLAGLAASAFSFARANSRPAWVALSTVLLATAVVCRRGGILPARIRLWPAAAPVALFTLLLAFVLRPVEEIDSLYNLHYVLGWYANQSTPFRFAYNYVPFWELTYLPGLVLARSDVFLWVQSLKAVVLLGVLLDLLARELDLPEPVRVLAVCALLLFPHLWSGPSGVATIKNDMIHAAGQAAAVLLLIRAAKGSLNRTDRWLAAAALVFLSVKFSGPVMIAAGLVVAVVVVGGRLRSHWREAAKAAVFAGGVWLATVGIYYLRNAITYKNPFYPFEIDLLVFRLPGRADLSYTAIVHNLGDARLWKAFFLPAGGLSPAGLLFPVVLPVLLLGSMAVCVRELRRRHAGRTGSPVRLAAALYQLVVWGVYVRSIYSASGFPGDLAFVLNDLNSLRYVEGTLLAGELFLVALLWRHTVRYLVGLLLVLHGASRLWLILRREPELASLWATVVMAAVIALWLFAPGRWKLLAVAALVFAGAWRLEQRRPGWLAAYQPLYGPLYEAPPQRIYYAVEDEFSQQQCAHLPVAGRRLQHEVVVGPPGVSPPDGTQWLVWLRRLPGDPTLPAPAGFRLAAEAPAGALYRAEGSPGEEAQAP